MHTELLEWMKETEREIRALKEEGEQQIRARK